MALSLQRVVKRSCKYNNVLFILNVRNLQIVKVMAKGNYSINLPYEFTIHLKNILHNWLPFSDAWHPCIPA